MKLVRQSVASVFGLLLTALLVSALAPKATRALAAALVQVTNTAANPVPVATVPVVPFGASLCVQAFTNIDCQPNTDRFSTPTTTPAGLPANWLVIDQVAGLCTSGASNSVVMTPGVTFGFPPANTTQTQFQPFYFFPVAPGAGEGNPPTVSVVESNVRIYVPSGDFVFGNLSVAPNGSDGRCTLTVTGHLE